jgi:hypothetical protein
MAGDDRFDVRPSALTGHADTVGQVGEAIEVAAGNGGDVDLGTATFGQLGQDLPALFSPVRDVAVDAMNSASDALRNRARALRSAAEQFAEFDRAAARRLDNLGNQR